MVLEQRTPRQRLIMAALRVAIVVCLGVIVYFSVLRHQTLSRVEGELQELQVRLQSLRTQTQELREQRVR